MIRISNAFLTTILLIVSNHFASAQNPGGVSTNLELWLKTDAGTNCSTNNCGITSWDDQSPSGHHAAGTGNTVYSSASINFNPSLYFSDDVQPIYSDSVFGTVDRPIGVSSTIFVAGKIDQVADKCLFEIGIGSDPTRQFLLDQRYSADNPPDYDLIANKSSMWAVKDPGGSSDAMIFQNAGNIGSFSKNFDTDWTSGYYFIGDDATLNNRLTGNIAEVIYYDSQLSAADQQLVESYLAIKYGVTITSNNDSDLTAFEAPNEDGINEGDYVNSAGSIIWDASMHSTYHNNIAGIGRDDNSGLSQPKSICESAPGMIIIDKGGAFTSDNDFILWGTDLGSTNTTTIDVHPFYSNRLTRIWKTQVTGSPGLVTVSVIYPNNNTPGDYALLLDDTDTDFNSGATAHTTGASISGDTITFTSVPLANNMYFTLGSDIVVANTGPGGVIDYLDLWLKADTGTNCNTESCAIKTWNDQSIYSFDATGTGSSLFDEVYANYNPGLDLSGGPIPISGNIARTTGTSSTIIVVGKTTIADQGLIEAGTVSARQFFLDQRYASANNFTFQNQKTSIWQVSDAGGSNANILENGELIATTAINSTTKWTTGGAYFIGDDRTGGNAYTGKISEVIYFDKSLSATEQQKTQAYLAIKYGITLSSDNNGNSTPFESPNSNGINEGDYINSNNTVIWDASEGTAYYNNIIGIGRDDLSLLNQKQAHTVDNVTKIYLDNLAVSNANNIGSFAGDLEFLLVGNDSGLMCYSPNTEDEIPSGVVARIEREWKISNTNFSGNFSLEWQLSACANPSEITLSDLRLLVDDDGNFNNATIYSTADGITFSETSGLITIANINTTMVPMDDISYLTLASSSVNTALPVELLSFEVKVGDDYSAHLTWVTASEMNNDYFTIERSNDKESWNEIKRIEGSSTTNNQSIYKTTDTQPLIGRSFYRLKQTDFDGKFEYLGIRAINTNTLTQTLICFPNPIEGKITIRDSQYGISSIRVFSVAGEELLSYTELKESSVHEVTIDLSSLDRGLYLIKTDRGSSRLIKN